VLVVTLGVVVLVTELVAVTLPVPLNVGSDDGGAVSAYTERSLLVAYSVPSEPMTGVANAKAAVAKVHFTAPLPPSRAYTFVSPTPTYSVPSAPTHGAVEIRPPTVAFQTTAPVAAAAACTPMYAPKYTTLPSRLSAALATLESVAYSHCSAPVARSSARMTLAEPTYTAPLGPAAVEITGTVLI
jgi:hypothetical protein